MVRDHTTRRGLANSESAALTVLSDGAVAEPSARAPRLGMRSSRRQVNKDQLQDNLLHDNSIRRHLKTYQPRAPSTPTTIILAPPPTKPAHIPPSTVRRATIWPPSRFPQAGSELKSTQQ